MARKSKEIAEFGDFQTPLELASEVVGVVARMGFNPETVVEPSCGEGSFLSAARLVFPSANLFGLEINEQHLEKVRKNFLDDKRIALVQGSFFNRNWQTLLSNFPRPLLILGNPPWVTNSELGLLGSENLPQKNNIHKHKGLDALTGKSNFDISEWMLLQNLAWIADGNGLIAVLCKVSVARKVLAFAWKRNINISEARIYKIDALAHFGASVDACLFIAKVDKTCGVKECNVYPGLDSVEPQTTFGLMGGSLASSCSAYSNTSHLRGKSPLTWRSGVKHDCAKIMELKETSNGWMNGNGDIFQLENSHLFPLVKSSDIFNSRAEVVRKHVIVTQRSLGEETRNLANIAPLTWNYLSKHSDTINARNSVIYKGKPPFSMFGVGEYSFKPWKIAISGLYKKLKFCVFGPLKGKPILFDDTVYFLSFDDETEARRVLYLLESAEAREFFESMIFWDDKRPITADLLNRLDLVKLANQLRYPIDFRSVSGGDQMKLAI